MTDRSMGAEALAAVEAAQNLPVHLFVAELDSGTYRFCDGAIAVQWGGDTYTAAGDLLSFDGVRESAELKLQQTNITLSGVNANSVSEFLLDEYLGRAVRIYKTFLRSDGTAMDPVLLFQGRMGGPVIEMNPAPDEGTATISIPAVSHFADFERKPGRRTNDAVQQLHYPGDLFFEFNSQIPAQKQSAWGRLNT